MRKLLTIFIPLVPLLFTAKAQVIADTAYYGVSPTWIKVVSYRNSTTSNVPTITRLTDSLNAIRTLVSTKQNYLGFTPVANTATVNGHALNANVTVTASDVSLGNVTNESKATMFTNPTFTGSVTLPDNTVTNGMIAGSIATSKISNYTGYSINVQALTSSPADAQTIYFGMLPKAPVTAANTSKIYIRQAGTITGAELYCYSGTAGTNENWSIYIRLNNTTDYLIATVGTSASERVFSNTGLSISVSSGDYIEIKSVNPTWATNPLTTIFGGYIRIN